MVFCECVLFISILENVLVFPAKPQKKVRECLIDQNLGDKTKTNEWQKLVKMEHAT